MPGPIHAVLTAGSSHIHLRVDDGRGRGEMGGGGKALCGSFSPPPFPALLLKNKTKPQTKSKLQKIAIKEILK